MTGISTRITMKPRVEEIASGRGAVQGGSIYPDKRLHEFQDQEGQWFVGPGGIEQERKVKR